MFAVRTPCFPSVQQHSFSRTSLLYRCTSDRKSIENIACYTKKANNHRKETEDKRKIEPSNDLTIPSSIVPTDGSAIEQRPMTNKKFLDLRLPGPLVRAVTDMGFETPTEIQRKVVVEATKGHNIVASARTGTGKTAAYMLPALHRLHLTLKLEKKLESPPDRTRKPLVLVLAPTKELVEQVTSHTLQFCKYMDKFNIVEIHSGRSEVDLDRDLSTNVEVVIATPGTLLNALTSKKLLLDHLQCFVIDECDRMLNMGFLPDIMEIFWHFPRGKSTAISASDPTQNLQKIMMSATLLPAVEEFIKRVAPTHKRVDLNDHMRAPDNVTQVVYSVNHRRKAALLLYLLRRKEQSYISLKNKQVLVFCRTRQRCENLRDRIRQEVKKLDNGEELQEFKAAALHKGQPPTKREGILQRFRNGEIQILCATDMMSRGIDIPELPYVVNYDVPATPEEYIHRIGRTGRAGSAGKALTFVDKEPMPLEIGGQLVEINEEHFLANIEKFMKRQIPKSKVPGPWEDEEIEMEPALIQHFEKLRGDRIERIMEKKRKQERHAALQSKNPNRNPELNPKLAAKFNSQLEKANLETAPLRNFREGRYEDVVKNFDEKRAIKRGTIKKIGTKNVIVHRPRPLPSGSADVLGSNAESYEPQQNDEALEQLLTSLNRA
eukprot:TRINITY_DN4205_c0_g1_i1.p1 TRINITY_DN4205_c0_g1~~TRINITY_DN4205_c0_g1_i1.p1  ORF type:complete len:662 (-),score=162.37 TRINITY_DN4205_c0_g1_i1:33-2018(-)